MVETDNNIDIDYIDTSIDDGLSSIQHNTPNKTNRTNSVCKTFSKVGLSSRKHRQVRTSRGSGVHRNTRMVKVKQPRKLTGAYSYALNDEAFSKV